MNEEELVKDLKDSFPDLLEFNNKLKELRIFWKQQGKKVMRRKLKIWLEQFEKIVNWHRERDLLPYDWFDCEHKKIIELREILK